MSDDVLREHQIAPIIEDAKPDPALDALYSLQVATARQLNWPVPDRAEWEALYKAEIAASRKP